MGGGLWLRPQSRQRHGFGELVRKETVFRGLGSWVRPRFGGLGGWQPMAVYQRCGDDPTTPETDEGSELRRPAKGIKVTTVI